MPFLPPNQLRLCAECKIISLIDYNRLIVLALLDGGSTHGRLEVFSPERGWGRICTTGWSFANMRVACRQLGFLDGVRTFNGDHTAAHMALSLPGVDCVGNETSLFDCNYFAVHM